MLEGVITVHSTAIDFLGNRVASGPTVTVFADGHPPVISALPAGSITSATGLDHVEAAFVPTLQSVVISDTVLSLPLDEPAGAVWFDDATAQQNSAHCQSPPDCPGAGQAGQVDGAARFAGGGQVLEVGSDPSIDAVGTGSVSVQPGVLPP